MFNQKKDNRDKYKKTKTKKASVNKHKSVVKDKEHEKGKGGDSKKPTSSESSGSREYTRNPNLDELMNRNSTYGRRAVVSNWEKYSDLPPETDDNDDDDDSCMSFQESVEYSASLSSGKSFMLKETQEWLKQSESYESPFSLDVKRLEAGIACIPFSVRHDLPEESFCATELKSLVDEAKSNEILYKKMQDGSKSDEDEQKVNLNNLQLDFINDVTVIDDSALVEKTETKRNKQDSVSSELKHSGQCDVIDVDNIPLNSNVFSSDNVPMNSFKNISHFDADKSLNSSTSPSLSSLPSRGQRPKKFAELTKTCQHYDIDVNNKEIQFGERKKNKISKEIKTDDVDKGLNYVETSTSNIMLFDDNNKKLNQQSISSNNSSSNNATKKIVTNNMDCIPNKKISNSEEKVKELNKSKTENLKELTTIPDGSLSSNVVKDVDNKYDDNDEELDFLLGLKEPVSSVGTDNLSSLVILQNKLKTSNENSGNSGVEKSKPKSGSVTKTDEDLDEWLNSVLDD